MCWGNSQSQYRGKYLVKRTQDGEPDFPAKRSRWRVPLLATRSRQRIEVDRMGVGFGSCFGLASGYLEAPLSRPDK